MLCGETLLFTLMNESFKFKTLSELFTVLLLHYYVVLCYVKHISHVSFAAFQTVKFIVKL